MVSKNNAQMKDRYATKQVPHYGIRKLSIGVASVLLSTTLYMGVTAHADTVNRVADDVTQPVTSNNSSEHQGTLTIGDASTDKDTKTPANEVTSPTIVEASLVSMSPSNPSASQGSAATDAGASSTAVNTAADSAPTTPVTNKASHESNSQVQPSSLTGTIHTKLVRRPVMRLAAAAVTDSDELIVGKDVTISDFSVTVANGKNEFENSHADIKFIMHADDPSVLAGKRLTIQVDTKVWDGFYSSKRQDSNPATISYQGRVIGTLSYGYPLNFVYITFNDDVKNYAKIDVQTDLVVAGTSQHAIPYITSLYTSTQAKDGQTYYLTNDVTIGQQKYSSNLPSVIHYYALDSEFVSSVTDVTTTSYDQRDSELYAGTFYKTPNGIYYSQSLIYGGNNLYSEQSGQSGYLEGPNINVGTDIVTDRTQSYTATFDIDQAKLSPDRDSELMPITTYYLDKDYWDDKNLLPNTSDLYLDYSRNTAYTTTTDATVTKNGVIFNKLNGQSLATRIVNVEGALSRHTNYVTQTGKLHFTPALFKQLQAVAESDQNFAEAVNTVKTTGRDAKIKLVNPIDTGLKATIKTSDGKTKEVPLLIDTIDYVITTASTAPKGAMLVAAQGKTAKVYHHGDQNIPAVVDQNKLTKTITRTINVHEPGKKVTTIKQTVVLTQSVSVVDGKDVTYNGDWKAQGDSQWASYDVPSVPGYTASQSRVAQQEVTDATQDQTIDITYTANEHQISIEYVDNATGHVVKTDHVSGKTGQTVSITPDIPDGWELVSGQSVPSEVTVGADGAPTTVIKVQPQERSVTVKFVDDQSFDFDTSDHKKQVGQAITVTGRDGDTVDLKLTVPDKYQLADGQQLPTTYTFAKGSGDLKIHLVHKVVQLKATIDVKLDLLTGVRIYSNHETPITVTQDQWKQMEAEAKDVDSPEALAPSVKAGTLTGHVDYDLVYGNVVSFGDDWTSLNLGGQTYQLPNGDEVVNGVMALSSDYPWGKTLKEFFLKDNTNTDSDYANRPWHGYLSVNTTNNDEDIHRIGLQAGLVGDEFNALAKATGDRAATGIEMANTTIDLSWLQQNVGLSLPKINEQDGQVKYHTSVDAAGVYIPYVEKTATRTINVITPDGKTTTVKQTATLAKQVDLGKDAHPAWTTGEWASYDVPTIPGYTASQSNVAKETVTGTTEDQTINITYTANPQKIHINYVDAQRKLIHTTTVNGQTDQTVKVPNEVPDGWILYSGQNIPKSITFQAANNDRDYVVKHVQSFVLSTAPKEAGTIIEGTKAKTYPAGVSDADLNKTITRTILVKDANGRTVNTKTQTVHFVRNAVVDAVTGHVEYLGWSEDGSHIFATYIPVPKNGYTINSAKTTTVTPNDTDSTIELAYKPIPKTITVEYMTTDGKQIASQAVKADDNNQVKFVAPDGYVLATNTNTVDVSDLNNNIYRVLVRANEQTYTAGSTNIPENVKNLTKVVTRTIVIVMPNGHRRTIKQRVTFERTATIKSDGSVVYTDYQPVGHDAFNHIFIAHRFGYNLNFSDGSKSVTRIDHVTADTPDQTIVVTYARKNAN